MIIHTERLTLCPAGIAYLDSAYAYTSDIENTRFMMNLPNESREECAEYLRKAAAEWQKPAPEYYEFAVLLDGEHIGGVSLFREDDPNLAELGWIIHKKHWGKGIAAEAARAAMDFGIQKLCIRRFCAHCDSENFASRRVMEKLGMRLTSITGGRKNRASDEERSECLYEMEV